MAFDAKQQALQFLKELTVPEFENLQVILRDTLDLAHYAQEHDGHFHAHGFHTETEAEAFIHAYAALAYRNATPANRVNALGMLEQRGITPEASQEGADMRFASTEEASLFLEAVLPLRPAQPSVHHHTQRRKPQGQVRISRSKSHPLENAASTDDHHTHDHEDAPRHSEEDDRAAAEPSLQQNIERGARFIAQQYRGLGRALQGKESVLDSSGFTYDHTEGLHLHGSRVPAEMLAATGLAIAGSFAASRLKHMPGFVRAGLKLATALPVLRSLVGPEIQHALSHWDTAGGKSDLAKHATFATLLAADLFQQDNFSLSLAGNVGVAALSLIGRAQSNVAENLRDFGEFLHEFANEPVHRAGEDRPVLPETLNVGERITLKPGQTIPVDGTIRRIVGHDGAELRDASIWAKVVNGQDKPLPFGIGESVRQGVTIADEKVATIELEVNKPYALSYLSDLARHAEELGKNPARSQTDAERLANVVTMLSLGGGLVTAALNIAQSQHHHEGFSFGKLMNDVGEFIAKTSPCGILIAPAALALTRRALANKHQVISRSLHEFEEVCHLDTLLLDWTGTVTENNRITDAFFVDSHGHPLDSHTTETLMGDVAAVEQRSRSQNPTAKAIQRQYPAGDAAVHHAKEDVGLGVTGEVNVRTVRAGRREFVAGDDAIPEPLQQWAKARVEDGLSVTFVRHGENWGAVSTTSAIRPDVLQTIQYLESQGVEVHIVTGDSAETAMTKGALLGWDEEKTRRLIHAGCLPEDKANLVGALRVKQPDGKTRHVGMVGDGINDFPAIERATTTAYEGEAPGFAFVMHGNDYPELAKAASFRIQNISDVASLREAVKEPAERARQSTVIGVGLSTLFGVGHLANFKFGAALGEVLHEVTIGLQYLVTGVKPAEKADKQYGSWLTRTAQPPMASANAR